MAPRIKFKVLMGKFELKLKAILCFLTNLAVSKSSYFPFAGTVLNDSIGETLLVDLKMPPNRTGTYSACVLVLFSIPGKSFFCKKFIINRVVFD